MGRATYDFSNEVVFITGCARGQGLAHASALAAAGARIWGVDSSRVPHSKLQYELSSNADIDHAAEALRRLHPEACVRDVNILDQEAVQTVLADLRSTHGRLDHLICNAGVNYVAPLVETPEDVISFIIDVNLVAHLKLIRHAMSMFDPRRGGSITLISSLGTQRSSGRQAAYAASKGGLEAVTRTLAVELGPKGIRVNAVLPTLVHTPQARGLSRGAMTDETLMADCYPLAGFAGLQASDVSLVLMFLMSDSAKAVTGTSVIVDGGRSVKA